VQQGFSYEEFSKRAKAAELSDKGAKRTPVGQPKATASKKKKPSAKLIQSAETKQWYPEPRTLKEANEIERAELKAKGIMGIKPKGLKAAPPLSPADNPTKGVRDTPYSTTFRDTVNKIGNKVQGAMEGVAGIALPGPIAQLQSALTSGAIMALPNLASEVVTQNDPKATSTDKLGAKLNTATGIADLAGVAAGGGGVLNLLKSGGETVGSGALKSSLRGLFQGQPKAVPDVVPDPPHIVYAKKMNAEIEALQGKYDSAKMSGNQLEADMLKEQLRKTKKDALAEYKRLHPDSKNIPKPDVPKMDVPESRVYGMTDEEKHALWVKSEQAKLRETVKAKASTKTPSETPRGTQRPIARLTAEPGVTFRQPVKGGKAIAEFEKVSGKKITTNENVAEAFDIEANRKLLESQGKIKATVPEPTTTTPTKGLVRNYRAGMNNGSIQFANETQRELYDYAAAKSSLMKDRGLTKESTVMANRKAHVAKMEAKYSPEELSRAYDIHEDVKAQMKGVGDSERRVVVDNTIKTQGGSPGTPVKMGTPMREYRPTGQSRKRQLGGGFFDVGASSPKPPRARTAYKGDRFLKAENALSGAAVSTDIPQRLLDVGANALRTASNIPESVIKAPVARFVARKANVSEAAARLDPSKTFRIAKQFPDLSKDLLKKVLSGVDEVSVGKAGGNSLKIANLAGAGDVPFRVIHEVSFLDDVASNLAKEKFGSWTPEAKAWRDNVLDDLAHNRKPEFMPKDKYLKYKEAAKKWSEDQTYNGMNKPAEAIDAIRSKWMAEEPSAKRDAALVGLNITTKFQKIITNVNADMYDRTPYGIVKGIAEAAGQIKRGKLNKADMYVVNKAAERISKGAFGTGLMAVGYHFSDKFGVKLVKDDGGRYRVDVPEWAEQIGGPIRPIIMSLRLFGIQTLHQTRS
jgi:hypothetical protein